MYKAGTMVEIDAYTKAGQRVNTEVSLEKAMTLDEVIEELTGLAKQIMWRKFSIRIDGRWGRWHYLPI